MSLNGDLAGLARRHQPEALRGHAAACDRFATAMGLRGDAGAEMAYGRMARDLRDDASAIATDAARVRA